MSSTRLYLPSLTSTPSHGSRLLLGNGSLFGCGILLLPSLVSPSFFSDKRRFIFIDEDLSSSARTVASPTFFSCIQRYLNSMRFYNFVRNSEMSSKSSFTFTLSFQPDLSCISSVFDTCMFSDIHVHACTTLYLYLKRVDLLRSVQSADWPS